MNPRRCRANRFATADASLDPNLANHQVLCCCAGSRCRLPAIPGRTLSTSRCMGANSERMSLPVAVSGTPFTTTSAVMDSCARHGSAGAERASELHTAQDWGRTDALWLILHCFGALWSDCI